MKKWRAGALTLLAAVFLFAAAPAGKAETGADEAPEAEEAATAEAEAAENAEENGGAQDFPALNDEGFLDEGEFVYEDPEKGLWRYCSDTLWVEIRRISQEKPLRTWYEAEIRCAEDGEFPHMIPVDPEKWMRKQEYPYKLARMKQTVIAVSSDYAWHRYVNKTRTGIVIREGKIWSDKTWKKGAKKFPNLDTLAIFPDGDMQVFDSDEKTAEEYLEMGARDVLAFGPWLIRDGELNTAALEQYGKSSAERVAVGMAEKGHYWFMMLEGRSSWKKRSKGDGISFLAEKLLEKGCRTAFNLDGGQTATIVFMGHQLCKMDEKPRNLSSRRTAEILGVGTSTLVAAPEDPW